MQDLRPQLAFTRAKTFAGRACIQAIKSFVFGPWEAMDLMDLVYSTSFAKASTFAAIASIATLHAMT